MYIDGPYGTPSNHIFEAEHAVLISSGIGVTPFASILQSIMNRFKLSKQICPNCEHVWSGQIPSTILNLKKVTSNCSIGYTCIQYISTLLAWIF